MMKAVHFLSSLFLRGTRMILLNIVADFLRDFGTLGAISFSGLVALAGISRSRKVAGQRATLDLIDKSETTDSYREASRTFHNYTREGRLIELSTPVTAEQHADREKALKFLNHYELISVGINDSFLNENIYRQWMETNFLIDWNDSSEFIQRERWKYDPEKHMWQYRQRLYENYQKLAEKWGREKGFDINKLDKSFSKPPERPEGPGDSIRLQNKQFLLKRVA